MIDVVRRAAAGAEDALDRLLIAAPALPSRFTMAVCGHPEDAEDAMQEALVRTYKHLGQIRDVEAFRPWLYRTVRNVCLMSRRKRAGAPAQVVSLDDPGRDGSASRTAIDVPSPHPGPEAVTSQRRLRSRLARALSTLPPAFRAVVFLRDMEGLSTRETAQTLGLSEDNVKARLSRARLALRRELAGTDGMRGRGR